MRRISILLAVAVFWSSSGWGYSGSGGIWATRFGDFVSKNYAGTQTGIQAALDFVAAAGGGSVQVGPGLYGITSPLKIGVNSTLRGFGRGAAIIEAASGFSGTAMVMNSDTTGTQQWCAIENLTLDGNSDLGRTVPRAILMKGIGQPSRILDVTIYNVSGTGIWREGTSSNAANFVIQNSGVAHCGSHCVMIAGYSGMTAILSLDVEDPGSGAAGLMIDGPVASFYPSAIFIEGLHVELLASGEAGLWIDDSHGILADGVAYYGSGGTGDLVKITGTSANAKNITIRGIVAGPGSLANAINDTAHGRQVSGAGAIEIPFYCTDGIEAASITSGGGGVNSNAADLAVNSGSAGTTKARVLVERNGQIDWLAQGDGTLEQIQFRHGMIFGTTAGGGLGYITTGGLWRLGDTNTPTEALEIAGAGKLKPGSTSFTSLGAPANGSLIYCSDCTKATPCASGGSGALAVRINGAWDCNP